MDTDLIRKGVEMADGFSFEFEKFYIAWSESRAGDCSCYAKPDDIPHWFLDALAAQLVRQVDADPRLEFESNSVQTAIVHRDGITHTYSDDPNISRTMNTIKAIVDSRVLESA